ncbi:MAG: alpha/beta hydrolase [Candidatus Binataceae bacterium]|jgi:pimeloyl-ACP methyl ester carboxylesterase
MATFVLVHGAWHGGWCYRQVAQRLRQAGHEVYTPTLTGLGERAHLMNRTINLDTHVQDVLGVIRCEELSDFVLCGHSYGGMVITGVTEKISEKIRSLVYLDAFVPLNGHSLLDIVPAEMQEAMRDDARHNGEGYLVTPLSAEFFNVNAKDAAWVDRMCVKHPIACFEQKLQLAGGIGRVPRRTYVLATGYGAGAGLPFTSIAERLKNDGNAWHIVSVPCGHDVMVDLPDEVAELLIAASA